MANPALIILLLVFLSLPQPSEAVTIDISQHSGIIKDSTGNYKTINGRGTITSINTGTQLQVQNKVPFPTTKGNQYVDISRTALVDLAKVGGALASLAKKLSPLGMAAGTVAYICTETNICDVGGVWTFESGEVAVGQNQTSDLLGDFQSGISPYPVYPNLYGAAGHMCDNTAGGLAVDHIVRLSDSGTTHRYQVYCDLNGSPVSSGTATAPASTISGDSRTATDQDWLDQESNLDDPASTDHILTNDGQVPVDVSTPPTLDAPINKSISTENKEIKDGAGNTVGTETTNTSIQITDAATSQNPNYLDFSETTTVTNYDINNSITNQTTTVTETEQAAPPDAPEQDFTVEFDTVTDTPLQEKIVDAPLDTTSWGGGVCPPDIDMVTSFGTFYMDSQPFCDFAIAIKPVILLVASIVGAFIVVTSARPATT